MDRRSFVLALGAAALATPALAEQLPPGFDLAVDHSTYLHFPKLTAMTQTDIGKVYHDPLVEFILEEGQKIKKGFRKGWFWVRTSEDSWIRSSVLIVKVQEAI